MDWKLICVLIAFTIYVVYNAFALKFFGVPRSLSNTFYLYKAKKEWCRILFPIMMMSILLFLIPSWLEISESSNLQFMTFLAASGIMFTGSAPAFNSSDLENRVHTISAIVAAVFALLWVIFAANLWYIIIVWFVLIAVVALLTKTLKFAIIYWLETVAFMSTFTSIIVYFCLNN